MCGLGEALENKGFGKGYDTGYDMGKLVQLIELVLSGDLAIEKASQKAGMTQDEFIEKMKEVECVNGV